MRLAFMISQINQPAVIMLETMKIARRSSELTQANLSNSDVASAKSKDERSDSGCNQRLPPILARFLARHS